MRVRTLSFLAAAAGLAIAGSAQASFHLVFSVTAEDESGNLLSAPFVRDLGDVNADNFSWSLANDGGPVSLGGAMLNDLRFDLHHDPVVGSNFNVTSGPVNTVFTINSAIVNFAEDCDLGRATAFIGVTDSATFGTPGNVVLTGLQPGGNAFQARYNAANTAFANLIPGLVYNGAGGGSTAFTGQSDPLNNFISLGGIANSINSQFKFSLSAFDRASGTSTFEVIPAPGSAALLALGGLAAARRRRSV